MPKLRITMLVAMLGQRAVQRIGILLSLLAVSLETIHITKPRSMEAIRQDPLRRRCIYPKHRSWLRRWRSRGSSDIVHPTSEKYVKAGTCVGAWRSTSEETMEREQEKESSLSRVEKLKEKLRRSGDLHDGSPSKPLSRSTHYRKHLQWLQRRLPWPRCSVEAPSSALLGMLRLIDRTGVHSLV